jgi:hypothetical protein
MTAFKSMVYVARHCGHRAAILKALQWLEIAGQARNDGAKARNDGTKCFEKLLK